MSIGEVAKPPFAVLPDPESLFRRRSARLLALAPGHELEDYLRLLAELVQAQHDIQPTLPAPRLPDAAAVERACGNGMPPLSLADIPAEDLAGRTLDALLADLAARDLPGPGAGVVQRLEAAPADLRREMMRTALDGAIPEELVAEHVLVIAALQVHAARMAARLDAARLRRVADGACPACGAGPVASMVVGWPGAHGTRFCCCSVCSTLWHVVRIKCLLCNADGGISYHGVENGSEVVRAETCDDCKGYVKILHQHKDADLEPVADDVASLGLDLLLRDEGWRRGGANPFLAGY
jgi:FdhE protein